MPGRLKLVLSVLMALVATLSTTPGCSKDKNPVRPPAVVEHAWSPLGSGFSGAVYALAEHNGQLIAGGAFTKAGGLIVHYVSAWNGSSWSALGSGMNSSVYALAEYDGQLIAGGSFDTAGAVSANHIAAWRD